MAGTAADFNATLDRFISEVDLRRASIRAEILARLATGPFPASRVVDFDDTPREIVRFVVAAMLEIGEVRIIGSTMYSRDHFIERTGVDDEERYIYPRTFDHFMFEVNNLILIDRNGDTHYALREELRNIFGGGSSLYRWIDRLLAEHGFEQFEVDGRIAYRQQ